MNLVSQIIWSMALLSGCSRTIEISVNTSEALHVSVYSQNMPNKECVIVSGSKEHEALVQWFAQNAKNWSATPATYVPGVSISGKEFSINFIGSAAVLNYGEGQYSHSASPAEYLVFNCGSGG